MDGMIRTILEKWILQRRSTLLGVGPMSKICVDAAIELSNENRVPLMLIASRRQIDCEELGGGYVNNWTTQQFADYVLDKDKSGRIILARDHGGPWQNEREKSANLGLRKAMESAKLSYTRDIDAGFQILHIDPSVDPHGAPTIEESLDRMFELYEFCWSYARRSGREIFFEVGTEEQSGSTNTPEELKYTLTKVQEFCRRTICLCRRLSLSRLGRG
jgi:tagatose-1,6-bisphosphate aldolase non-catalytic subunit AgaZ/GatZ